MDGRRPEMRRTMTLSEQLSTPDPAIRDFLKIPHDADVGNGDSPSAVDAQGSGGGGGDRTTGWKPLRDRLRLRRAVGAWQKPKPGAAAAHAPTNSGDLSNISSANNRSNKYNYNPGEAAAAFSRTFSRAPSLRAPSLKATPTFSRVVSTRAGPAASRSSSRRPATHDFRDVEERRHDDDGEEEEDDDEEEDEDEEEEEKEAPAAQMSLMALLGATDEWDDDEDEEDGGGGARKKGEGDDDEDDGEGREEEMVHVCCVCMVRHKGAAFIPCGHTFCRLCSRELWVSRGNCPLCNGFIQEILDIF
ncbi:uncharacterized protein [Miscanthus floridulus]|uniref:uncharacterized protein n=1 Tax=Miscanthus floridulus TaxID=154761 RepID=UPI003459CC2B